MAGARRVDPGWLEHESERPHPYGMEHILGELHGLLREAHVTGRLALLPALNLAPKHNFGVRHDWQWEWYFDLAASRLIDGDGRAHPLPIANRCPPEGVRTLIVGPGEPIPPIARGYPRVVRRFATSTMGHVFGLPSVTELGFDLIHSIAVRELARETLGEIAARGAGRFVAVHVRRGDRLWQYPASLTEPEGIRNHLRERIPDGSTVFVMSDERDPNFWTPLKRNYRLFRYTDFPRLAAIVSRERGGLPDNYLLYAVEKEIARTAWMRIGTFPTTWSGRSVGNAGNALVDRTQCKKDIQASPEARRAGPVRPGPRQRGCAPPDHAPAPARSGSLQGRVEPLWYPRLAAGAAAAARRVHTIDSGERDRALLR